MVGNGGGREEDVSILYPCQSSFNCFQYHVVMQRSNYVSHCPTFPLPSLLANDLSHCPTFPCRQVSLEVFRQQHLPFLHQSTENPLWVSLKDIGDGQIIMCVPNLVKPFRHRPISLGSQFCPNVPFNPTNLFNIFFTANFNGNLYFPLLKTLGHGFSCLSTFHWLPEVLLLP